MIDLNHILLFIAFVSPLAILARAWRPGPHHGWRVAAIVVLVIAGTSWFVVPAHAGYLAGVAWLFLLLLPAIGLRKMMELAEFRRYTTARRLATALQILHPSAELRQQTALFRDLEARQRLGLVPAVATEAHAAQKSRRRQMRRAPAVLWLILILFAAFLFEIMQAGRANPMTLQQLGALEPYRVLAKGEYWRLLTALFLHYDVLHLLFNVFGLYILGPPLERAVGSLRFSAGYLISGIGSSIGVVCLWRVGWTEADQLVGASGCILGIVGAWAGFLLRHRHMPLAKQRLSNVLLIVVIQFAFDLSTPQISMAAHLCGLVTGFIFGLLVGEYQKGDARD